MRLRRVHMKKMIAARAEIRIIPAIVTPAIDPLDILLGIEASGEGPENGSPMLVGITTSPDCSDCEEAGEGEVEEVEEVSVEEGR